MSEASELFKNCIMIEKALTLLRENPNVNGAEISAKLNSIRYDYRRILLDFPQFSFQNNKDVHGMLWKQGFYKQIEEFRHRIQKTMQIVERNTDTGMSMQEKAKIHLLKLSSAFSKFLTDSATFYQDFFIQLESQYKLSVSNAEVMRSMYRCLLYLGDIARYKELYSENKKKEYTEASKYYEKAGILVPSAGNPQNQLAVLAIYVKADLDAVYHYCRSILISQPFTAAYDNLTVLFDKSSKSIMQNNTINSDDKPAERMSHFIKKFIKLHSMLFELTKQTLQSKLQINAIKSDFKTLHNQLEATTTATDVEKKSKIDDEISLFVKRSQKSLLLPQFNVFVFEELAQFLFQDLDTLFTTPYVNDRFLKMLLVICLFTVHNAATSGKLLLNSIIPLQSIHTTTTTNILVPDPNEQGQPRSTTTTTSSSSSLSPMEMYNEYIHKVLLVKPANFVAECIPSHVHSVPESLALTTLFNLISRIASKIDALEGSNDKMKKTIQNKLLPVVSLFTEWARHYNGYLVPTTTNFQSTSVRDVIFSLDKKNDDDNDDDDVNVFQHDNENNKHVTIQQLFEENIIRETDLKAALICNPDMILNENRSRSSVKSSILNLKRMLEKSHHRIDNTLIPITTSATTTLITDGISIESPPPLREHIELRGLFPLSHSCETYFVGKDPLYYTPPIINEEVARDRRMKTIHLFLNEFLIIPSISNTISPERNRERSRRRGGGGGDESVVNRDDRDDNDALRSRGKPRGKLVDVSVGKRREKRGDSSRAYIKDDNSKSLTHAARMTIQSDRRNRMKKDYHVHDQSNNTDEIEYPPLPSNLQQQQQHQQQSHGTSLEAAVSISQRDKERIYAKHASSRLFSGVPLPVDINPPMEQSDDEDEEKGVTDERDDDECYDYNFDECLEIDDDDEDDDQKTGQQSDDLVVIPERRSHTFSDYLSNTSSSSFSAAGGLPGHVQYNVGSLPFQFSTALEGKSATVTAPVAMASKDLPQESLCIDYNHKDDPMMISDPSSSSLKPSLRVRNETFQFSNDEEDIDDDVVIFRPAFARPLNQTAAISRTPSESPLVRDTSVSPYHNLMTSSGSFTGWESSSLIHSNNTTHFNNDINWFGNNSTINSNNNSNNTITTTSWWSQSRVIDMPFSVPLNQAKQQQQQQQHEMLMDVAPPPGLAPPGFKAQPQSKQYHHQH